MSTIVNGKLYIKDTQTTDNNDVLVSISSQGEIKETEITVGSVGGVQSVTGVNNVNIDNTDLDNPIIEGIEGVSSSGSVNTGVSIGLGDSQDDNNGTKIQINDETEEIFVASPDVINIEASDFNLNSPSIQLTGQTELNGTSSLSRTNAQIDAGTGEHLIHKDWFDAKTLSFVPYTGATQNVNISPYSLTSSSVSTTGNISAGGRLNTFGNAIDFQEDGNSGSSTITADIVGSTIHTLQPKSGTIAHLSDIPTVESLYTPDIIWGEETLEIDSPKVNNVFSYGNGGSGNIGIPSYVTGQKVTGLTCNVLVMGTSMTLGVTINGVAQTGYDLVVDSNNKVIEFTTPIDLNLGDQIGFNISSVTGVFRSVRAGVIIHSPLKIYSV